MEMPFDGKKGITVKIDAELHAEVRQYLESHSMTMAEFITLALQDELHPTIAIKEDKSMEKMRTLALQIPEDLFQQIKDYLHRNNMTQKEFIIGLIEDELQRDLIERNAVNETEEGLTEEQDGGDYTDNFEDEATAEYEEAEEYAEPDESTAVGNCEAVSGRLEDYDKEQDESELSGADENADYDEDEEETENYDEDEDFEDESENENMGFSMIM